MTTPFSVTTTATELLPTLRPRPGLQITVARPPVPDGLITIRTVRSTWLLPTTLNGHRKPTSGAENTNPAIAPTVIREITKDKKPSFTTTTTTVLLPT